MTRSKSLIDVPQCLTILDYSGLFWGEAVTLLFFAELTLV
jgi:hypothetical protein